jgi:hypothetical protein
MQRAAQPDEPAGCDVSTLLRAWSDGDQSALDKLTPIVYDELHRLARRHMRGERPGHSLQTTALVNEAYIRLVDYKRCLSTQVIAGQQIRINPKTFRTPQYRY